MSHFVVVAKYSFPHEANIAKMHLEGAGISAFIADEHTVNMQWLYSDAMGGVRLFVSESDVEMALEVLNNDEPIEYDDAFASQFEELEELIPENKTVTQKPIIKLGYAITKVICWLLVFRAIYFASYTFHYDGVARALVTFVYYGWIPMVLIYCFHQYHGNGKNSA